MYNGTIFQTIVEEFLELVSEANTSKKYISLKYFSETRQEIDNFFDTAKTIYKNDQMVEPGQTAMEMIVGGSKSLSDIEEKQSKFYYLLSKNHITEEKKVDFYAPKYKTANFESFAYTDKELKDVRLISHINKLRNNQVFEDYAFAECILLSETGAVLEFSKKFISEKESELRSTSGKSDICLVPYAVNLYTLTNTLWYRLNKSLNLTGEPTTVNSVVRAQIVLSKYINESVVKEYESLVERNNKNDIDRGELMFTIMRLRQKSKKPENIIREGVEDAINYLCEKDFDKFAEDYQKELAEHKHLEKEYSKVQNDLNNQAKDIEILKKENDYNALLYEYRDADKELSYIRERKEEYNNDFITQKNKSEKSKHTRKKVAFSIYVGYYFLIICLIVYLTWDDMRVKTL